MEAGRRSYVNMFDSNFHCFPESENSTPYTIPPLLYYTHTPSIEHGAAQRGVFIVVAAVIGPLQGCLRRTSDGRGWMDAGIYQGT